MKFYLALLYLLCSSITLACASVNYCGSRMCGHTNAHTLCQYQYGPARTCIGYIEAPLSLEEKARVLGRLNRRRSDVAMGVDGLPPAGDMLKLRWVEELSREAQLWADQCKPPSSEEDHDTCRDLYSVTVGQCVASIVGEAPGLRPETMVDMWYMQRISYTGNITSYVPSTSYDDFAQIMWSRTYMMGCARSRFMAQLRGRFRSVERLVCNFAPRGPVPSRPLWTPGDPISMCPPRSQPDPELTALCTFQAKTNESDDEKNKMTHEEHVLLDTVTEIENNNTLNYRGSLDAHYLTKLAISTYGSHISTELNYNYNVYKREILDLLNENVTYSYMNSFGKPEEESTTKKIWRKKVNQVGRPKPYDLEELEELYSGHTETNIMVGETTEKKDLYGDYEFVDTVNDQEITTSVTSVIQKTHTSEIYNVHQDNLTTSKDEEKVFDSTTNEENSTSYYNESLIDDKVIEDYLSDPESFRRIQEELERIENSLSSTTASTVAKVRRELRDNSITGSNSNKRDDFKTLEMLAEFERNKTMERGPMLNMVLKYIPYLKPYEKSIMGGSDTSRVARIVPSAILLLTLCL